jgi:hypothetical protein
VRCSAELCLAYALLRHDPSSSIIQAYYCSQHLIISAVDQHQLGFWAHVSLFLDNQGFGSLDMVDIYTSHNQ